MTDTAIEFTDRYGGRAPSYLTSCHGQCEAMGCYPVRWSSNGLTKHEYREINRIIDTEGASEDGWYFVRCPDCDGTGRVSRWVALARIPGHVVRWLRFQWLIRFHRPPHAGTKPAR